MSMQIRQAYPVGGDWSNAGLDAVLFSTQAVTRRNTPGSFGSILALQKWQVYGSISSPYLESRRMFLCCRDQGEESTGFPVAPPSDHSGLTSRMTAYSP